MGAARWPACSAAAAVACGPARTSTAKFGPGMPPLLRSLWRVKRPLPSALQTAGTSAGIMQELCFKEGNEILEFFKAKKRREKIDSLFYLAIQQDARQSWPLSCLMSSSAFFLFFFLFLLPLLLPLPSSTPLFPTLLPSSLPSPFSFSSPSSLNLYCHKTPFFSKSFWGSEAGIKSHAVEMLSC